MKSKTRSFCSLIIIGAMSIHIASCNYYSLEVLCGKSSLTEIEAREIAAKRLEDFCEREKIDKTRFPAPDISKQEDVPWIIDYTSKKDDDGSYYFFRVTIDNCGRIEKSWQQYPLKIE